jgi:hypothetical protein
MNVLIRVRLVEVCIPVREHQACRVLNIPAHIIGVVLILSETKRDSWEVEVTLLLPIICSN